MATKGQTAAKVNKADEFYTTKDIIEAELGKNLSYRKHFEDKVVLMNCDDPEWSEFWKFFVRYFHVFKLKKIISTHYNPDGKPSYKLEWDGSMIGGTTVNMIKTPLNGNGDFASDECVALLDEADICVTNPPFSKFRSYLKLLVDHNKQFVIIGNINAVTYKEIFPLIRDNKMWAGYAFNKTMDFIMPDSYEVKGKGYVDTNGKKHGYVPSIAWYTNINIAKRHEDLDLNRRYDPADYPKYDNYDAIEVSKVTEIPNDYFGLMGVPITFLDKFNPSQFEIVTLGIGEDFFVPTKKYKPFRLASTGEKCNAMRQYSLYYQSPTGKYLTEDGYRVEKVYARLIIKRIVGDKAINSNNKEDGYDNN